MDLIWYAGALTAAVACVAAHHPSAVMWILGLHLIKETLDWQHREDHERRILEIERGDHERRILEIERRLPDP